MYDGAGSPASRVSQVPPASRVRWTCSRAVGGMCSDSLVIGTSHSWSARCGWVTTAKPKSVGSPSAIEVQVSPLSSER